MIEKRKIVFSFLGFHNCPSELRETNGAQAHFFHDGNIFFPIFWGPLFGIIIGSEYHFILPFVSKEISPKGGSEKKENRHSRLSKRKNTVFSGEV
ncbi:hypothetical protein LBBP_00036 [Leptospira borgpetersenii serovar Ballum]|uniref:Uncharacterized protein n=1 Tax=Leptospira borgpetersenii serovar Ballum TaxID=280505 RepID=A0A0S2IL80_LEPBO|nr:hypothetical protein LBBP_00036 [Leptospira borgpetersenii serovar Ballum]